MHICKYCFSSKSLKVHLVTRRSTQNFILGVSMSTLYHLFCLLGHQQIYCVAVHCLPAHPGRHNYIACHLHAALQPDHSNHDKTPRFAASAFTNMLMLLGVMMLMLMTMAMMMMMLMTMMMMMITGGVTRVVGGRGGERLRLVLLLRGDASSESTLCCSILTLSFCIL